MPVRGFGGADREPPSGRAEGAFDDRGLGRVVEAGRGSVGVDVIDVRRCEARLVEGDRKRARGCLDAGLRDVCRVGGRRVPGELRQNRRSTRRRSVPRLQDDDARASAEDHAESIAAERAAHARGVAAGGGGEHPHRLPAPQNAGGDGRLGATGDHDVGAVRSDYLRRFADGMRCSRTRRRQRQRRSAEAPAHAHLGGRCIVHDSRNAERMQARGAFGVQLVVAVVLRDHAAHAAADGDARPAAVGVGQLEPGGPAGFASRHERELRETVEQVGLRGVEVLAWLEFRHFGRGLDEVRRRIELRNPPDAAAAGDEPVPECLHADAESRHGAKAGDGDAAHLSQPQRALRAIGGGRQRPAPRSSSTLRPRPARRSRSRLRK